MVPNSSGKADVLFIVDSTTPLFLTITQMRERLGDLFAKWQGIDFQVGIMNADSNPKNYRASGGRLMQLETYPVAMPETRYLKHDQYGAEYILGKNMNFHNRIWPNDEFCEAQPYCQWKAGNPLKQIINAISLRNDAANKGFFRPGAYFVPVIISAREEKDRTTKPADVIKAYDENLGGTMLGMRAMSIVIQPGDAKCLHDYSSNLRMGAGGQYGTSLAQFAVDTGGSTSSLCAKDYGAALADLGPMMSPKINSITLQHVPLSGSLNIQFSPAANITYTVTGKTVNFSQFLPAGTKLTISYQR